MSTWNVGDSQMAELLALPETGMGFQLVEGTFWGDRKQFLVFNAMTAVDLSALDLDFSADPAAVFRNELRIIAEMKQTAALHFAAPGPHSFRLLSSRVTPVEPPTTALVAATPSSLVKHVRLPANRFFHRFSAFFPDRRVDPTSGNFAPGTYACPESEVPFVPTGFTAVGRFALPNTLPASHHYVLLAPAGTSVSFGTVAPAFGQAGGGVEAYFVNAVVNQPPPIPPFRIPDE